jgi:hypothetical protein
MRVIGYHIIHNRIYNSDGESSDKDPLSFLLAYKPDTIRVLYHLDYCIANLFRWLQVSEPDLQKLVRNNDLYLAPYKFSYMDKKYFNLQHGSGKGSPFANFNDMYQFHRNSDLTVHEPEDYAMLAQEVGDHVYNALCRLDLHPKSLTSPVRCWEKEVLENMSLPGIDDIPEPAAKMAYDCCEGGWVEAFQKGHFDVTYDYDMRSAYGSFTRSLYDTRYGKWQNDPIYDPAAYYGYALCNVEVIAPISPITFKDDADEKLTPIGKFPRPRVLSKRYLDFILKYKIANIEILDGWWWFPDKLVTPFELMVDDLFNRKEGAPPGMEKDTIKRILAGIWGKFLFVKKKPKKDENPFGDLFNPVWAEDVETGCRLSSAAFIYDNKIEKNVLHVAVDGVLTNRQVNIKDNGGIGEWKLSNTGSGYVISSGICAIQGKDNKYDPESEDSDFILRYDWLKEQIANNPHSPEYVMSKLSPVTVQKAVTQEKMRLLGQHEEIVKTIDLAFESKRIYDRIPETGIQLQTRHFASKPIDISMMPNI